MDRGPLGLAWPHTPPRASPQTDIKRLASPIRVFLIFLLDQMGTCPPSGHAVAFIAHITNHWQGELAADPSIWAASFHTFNQLPSWPADSVGEALRSKFRYHSVACRFEPLAEPGMHTTAGILAHQAPSKGNLRRVPPPHMSRRTSLTQNTRQVRMMDKAHKSRRHITIWYYKYSTYGPPLATCPLQHTLMPSTIKHLYIGVVHLGDYLSQKYTVLCGLLCISRPGMRAITSAFSPSSTAWRSSS